jgi:hypothetical protein
MKMLGSIPVAAMVLLGAAACAPPSGPASVPACPPIPASAPGPDSQNPISSWGIDGAGYSAVVIGGVAYVGGVFQNAISPTGVKVPRQNLAAFCLADGSLLASFVANFNNGPRGGSGFEPGGVRALTTDGSSLFVGGDFTTLNGQRVNRLAKLDPTTGAPVAGFNPADIPSVVYALDYFGGRVYAGGDFSLGAPLTAKKGASFDAGTGAFAGWNPDADAKINSLEVSPDGQFVFVGGSFATVGGTAHDKLARTSAASGAASPVSFGQNGGVRGRVQAVILALAVDSDNVSAFAGAGPTEPRGSNGGNKAISYAPDGTENWKVTFDGDGQAVLPIGGVLYVGFHDGYRGDHTLKLLGLAKSTGALTSFKPTIIGGVLGVRAMAAGSNRLVAVGDFSSVGTTNKLHAVAIFP